jgi:hypothetical protein
VLEEEKVPEVVFAAAKALERLHDPAGTKALMEIHEAQVQLKHDPKAKRQTTDQFHSVPAGLMFVDFLIGPE